MGVRNRDCQTLGCNSCDLLQLSSHLFSNGWGQTTILKCDPDSGTGPRIVSYGDCFCPKMLSNSFGFLSPVAVPSEPYRIRGRDVDASRPDRKNLLMGSVGPCKANAE